MTFRMSGSRQEFVFMLSPLSSYYMAGEYTLNDSVVTCSDGLYTLVFKIKDNDTIVLQIPNQDGLHMSGLFIPNGTEFHYCLLYTSFIFRKSISNAAAGKCRKSPTIHIECIVGRKERTVTFG